MGIRYYAYAFDADMTQRALADPRSVMSDDPLADGWGLPHGFTSGRTDFEQSVPKQDVLYLDKHSISTPHAASSRSSPQRAEGWST